MGTIESAHDVPAEDCASSRLAGRFVRGCVTIDARRNVEHQPNFLVGLPGRRQVRLQPLEKIAGGRGRHQSTSLR